ncbi:MAG: hypothetical protein LBD50_01875 [Rickettsiales bacterium]|jgi:hypothetical protein|nr:hypothetical protein [Rickettsiales bacterium]
MKILQLFFILLFSAPVFAAAKDTPNKKLEKAVQEQSANAVSLAIEAGATNIDILLKKQLDYETLDYNRIKLLTSNMDKANLDKLYGDLIIEDCGYSSLHAGSMTKGRREFLKNISKLTPYDYKPEYRDFVFREIADTIAIANVSEEKIVSVFECVAKYDGNKKFLTFAKESAEKYNSGNLKSFIAALEREIAILETHGNANIDNK